MKTDPKTVPSLDEVRDHANLNRFPAYAAACERLSDLQLRLQRTEARISELVAQLNAAGTAKSDLTARATKLVSGDASSLDATRHVNTRTELAKLQEERPVLEEAIRLQQEIIARERQHASKAICEQVRPVYDAVVLALARALVELGLAGETYQALTDRLRAADVAWGAQLRPMAFLPAGGDPRHKDHSSIAMWLRDALEHKLIPESEVPPEWLDDWKHGYRYREAAAAAEHEASVAKKMAARQAEADKVAAASRRAGKGRLWGRS